MRPNVKCFILALLLLPLISASQISLEWELMIPANGGGFPSYNANSHESLKSIATADGGFVVQGYRFSSTTDALEIYVFKHDEEGTLVWEYTYESVYELSDEAYDIAMDSEGNIYIGAQEVENIETTWHHVYYDAHFLLIKLDSNGQFLWKKSIPGGGPGKDIVCRKIAFDEDDNIYTAGNFHLGDTIHATISKFTSQGDSLWQVSVIDPSLVATMELKDSTIILLTWGQNEQVVHFDLNGNELYHRPVDFVSPPYNPPKIDADGNIYTYSPTGRYQLIKMDMYGNTLWDYHKPTLQPPNVHADEMEDISIDDDGNVYTTGRFYGDNRDDPELYTNCDILTIKFDPEGQLIWEHIYRYDDTASCQIGHKVLPADDGKTYVAGYQSVMFNDDLYYSRDKVLLIYDQEGNLIDSLYHDDSPYRKDMAINMQLTDNAVYVYGWTKPENAALEQEVIKYSLTSPTRDLVHEGFPINIYPNPTNGNIQIDCTTHIEQCTIFDLLGRPVFNANDLGLNASMSLDNLPSGVYVLVVSSENGPVLSERLVVQH